jgi:uncharacterized protein (DUF433 family)
MDRRVTLDRYDWKGCDVVEVNPRKLGGRATVQDTRMHADGILENYEDGLTIDEIVESYGVERAAVEKILAFAAAKGMKATA